VLRIGDGFSRQPQLRRLMRTCRFRRIA
jgi:hypothetical protein